jgi:hypothetical protein
LLQPTYVQHVQKDLVSDASCLLDLGGLRTPDMVRKSLWGHSLWVIYLLHDVA